jgi:tetratricopeptide (TPR) repeat protein
MIERLLAAESALARGEVDAAERLFAQVAEADPRNAIAVVGLARIARRQGRDEEARELAERALTIDPDEAAAGRLLRELLSAAASPPAEPAAIPAPEPEAIPTPEPAAALPAPPVARPTSLIDRIRHWLAGMRGRA